MSGGPKPKPEVIDEIVRIYDEPELRMKNKGKRLTVLQVLDRLELKYPGQPLPSESFVQKLLKVKRKAGEFLERPWTVGLGFKYQIPKEIIPSLIELKKAIGDRLTIRIARWFNYLYPTLYPEIEKKYAEQYKDLLPKLGLVYQIAKQYARKEEIYEITTGEISPLIKAPDTSDIDERYLIKGDLSEDAIWGNFSSIFLPKTCAQWAKAQKEELTAEDIEKLQAEIGPLTQREIEVITEYAKALAHSSVAGLLYMHEHPNEIIPLIEKAKKAKEAKK